MNRIILLISISILCLSCQISNEEFLNKTIIKLKEAKSIEYDLIKHSLHRDRGVEEVDTIKSYFSFDPDIPFIGAKYQFVNNTGEEVYSGDMKYATLTNEKLVLLSEEINVNSVRSANLRLSILEIRKVLPELLNDSKVTIIKTRDVQINNIECVEFKIELLEKWISPGGKIIDIDKEGHTSEYFLSISKENYLPIKFKNIYPKGSGFVESTFTNIEINPSKNKEVWGHERFSSSFEVITLEEYFQRLRDENAKVIAIGDKAPEFSIPDLKNIKNTFPEANSDNLTLLEFWFPRCKGCIEAVPHLIEIKKKYKSKGLKVFGVEYTGFVINELKKYVEKNGIDYQILHQGTDVASKYGVFEAPTFFLIDKKGIIVYKSVGLDKDNLIKKIEEYAL